VKKKATPKTGKPTMRRVGVKAASDARAALEAMPVADRIAVVADDVASKRDEYRSIDPHELAGLLGVDGRCPDGDWVFVGFVPRLSVKEIMLQCDEEVIPELLETHVTSERCEGIIAKIKLLKRSEAKLRRASLDFLTEGEKQTIERLYMEREAASNGPMWVIANYTIEAPHGKKLGFETTIGDNGESFDLKTPYDERDGKFTDLSDCLIVD
jgi:hypothetical protein